MSTMSSDDFRTSITCCGVACVEYRLFVSTASSFKGSASAIAGILGKILLDNSVGGVPACLQSIHVSHVVPTGDSAAVEVKNCRMGGSLCLINNSTRIASPHFLRKTRSSHEQ